MPSRKSFTAGGPMLTPPKRAKTDENKEADLIDQTNQGDHTAVSTDNNLAGNETEKNPSGLSDPQCTASAALVGQTKLVERGFARSGEFRSSFRYTHYQHHYSMHTPDSW
jgi:hypothetical protein